MGEAREVSRFEVLRFIWTGVCCHGCRTRLRRLDKSLWMASRDGSHEGDVKCDPDIATCKKVSNQKSL